MKRNIVVLTDFSPAAAQARAYAAALAAPLGAELHLVHVVQPLPPTPTETGVVLPPYDPRYAQQTRQKVAEVASELAVPATADVAETTWGAAVAEAVARFRPQLLVAGLTATNSLLDEWLSNRALPLAHETGCPVLLVPEQLPATALRTPRRLVLAAEDKPFMLSSEALALAPLLETLQAEIITVCVLPHEERAGGWEALRAVQSCGLGQAAVGSGLHKVESNLPATGILQAAEELHADLIALLDFDHGWLHRLLSGSVISYVARHTPVPLLLLPAETPPTAT